jgi:hypothetical protein
MRYLLPAMALLLAACYRYAPATPPQVVPGVHARLALAGSNGQLRSVLGAETIAVEGQVVGASESAYTLAVAATLKPGVVSQIPRRIVWAGESVIIPSVAVSGVELRTLDRGRTARAVALGAVAAVITVRLIVSAVGSSGGGSDDGTVVVPP